MGIIKEASQSICDVRGEIGQKVNKKLQMILPKNIGYDQILKICRILDGQNDVILAELDYGPKEISTFKFAPITSVDVERSFSAFKCTLTELTNRMIGT